MKKDEILKELGFRKIGSKWVHEEDNTGIDFDFSACAVNYIPVVIFKEGEEMGKSKKAEEIRNALDI